MSKANPMNFYRKISKKNAEVSSALQKVLESGNVDVSTVMAITSGPTGTISRLFGRSLGRKSFG